MYNPNQNPNQNNSNQNQYNSNQYNQQYNQGQAQQQSQARQLQHRKYYRSLTPYYSFNHAITSFYKNYFSFMYRSPRSSVWWVFLFQYIISFILELFVVIDIVKSLMSDFPFSLMNGIHIPHASILILIVLFFAFTLPEFALYTRRMLDLNFNYKLAISFSFMICFGGACLLLLSELSGLPALFGFMAILNVIISIFAFVITLIPSSKANIKYPYAKY